MASSILYKERFDIAITAAGESKKGTFEIDNSATNIVGFTVTSDRDDLMFYRGSVKLQVNDNEILPEGFETKLLMTGLNIEPNDRYYTINEDSGNNIVELTYQDTNHANAAFVPYRVSLYVYSN